MDRDNARAGELEWESRPRCGPRASVFIFVYSLDLCYMLE